MADNRDWVSWDNSMKAHIDQVEVKWKNDLVLAMEKSAEIARLQSDLNGGLIDKINESGRQHYRTNILIGITFALMIVNLAVALYAVQEVYRP